MVDHLIVPVDGSHESWRAFDVALSLARACSGDIDVVEIVSDTVDSALALKTMKERVAETDTTGVPVRVSVEITASDVVTALAVLLERSPGATIVIGSHGRGRSAALIGSVTEALLRETFGPLVVVGPEAGVPDFSAPVIVTVDGSELSESVVPLAAAWAIELGATVWVVQVLDPDLSLPPDVSEVMYVNRVAQRLSALGGRTVQTEVLHGRHPADTVADYARDIGAALIVAATHGRTGASRLALGSTAAGLVKHGPCPVLLSRPPQFPS